MKIILTQGKQAIIDSEMFSFINQFKWQVKLDKKSNRWYAKRTKYIGVKNGKKKYKTIYLHEIILPNKPKHLVYYFKNGDSLDCRKDNIIFITRNKRSHITCKNAKGYIKKYNKFFSRITVNKKRIHLGGFKTNKLAFEKYKEYSNKFYEINDKGE